MKLLAWFLLHGFTAAIVGACIATPFQLYWIEIANALKPNSPFHFTGLGILLLPMALPIAMIISVPLTILPTYIVGGGLTGLFQKFGLENWYCRMLIGTIIGGLIGWAIMLRAPQIGPASTGMLYGAGCILAWFFTEPYFRSKAHASRSS